MKGREERRSEERAMMGKRGEGRNEVERVREGEKN